MNRILTLVVAAAFCATTASALSLEYTCLNAPRYWELDASRTNVRLRQQPTTSSPMLMMHVIESDNEYDQYYLYWDGDKSPRYRAHQAQGWNNELATNHTAYCMSEVLPVAGTNGEWTQVVYTVGLEDTNAGLNSKKAWVMTKFGNYIEPSGQPITPSDVAQFIGLDDEVRLNSRSSQHPGLQWAVLVTEDGEIQLTAPFVTPDNLLVLATVPVYTGSVATPGLSWHAPEDGVYARTNPMVMQYQTTDYDLNNVARQIERIIKQMSHADYETFARNVMENASANVWFLGKTDGKWRYLSSCPNAEEFGQYRKQGVITIE